MERESIMNEELKSLIEDYKQTDWTALLKEDLGKYHLKELKPNLDLIKNFFDSVIQNFDLLTDSLKNIAYDFLNQFKQTKEQIQNHTETSRNQQIIDQVNDLKNMILNRGYSFDWVLKVQKKSEKPLDDPIQKYRLARQEIEAEIKKLKQAQSQQSEQTIRAEASRYGEFFNEEAKENNKSSYIFGGCLIFLSILACLIAYYFFSFDSNITVNNIPELIVKGNLISKFFIFTIIVLLLATLKREYLALRHQYTVNRHRHNALSSHKEILSSIEKTASESDKEISNAILLELTKSMFNPQDTGFIKNQKDASENRIVEVSKSLFNPKE